MRELASFASFVVAMAGGATTDAMHRIARGVSLSAPSGAGSISFCEPSMKFNGTHVLDDRFTLFSYDMNITLLASLVGLHDGPLRAFADEYLAPFPSLESTVAFSGGAPVKVYAAFRGKAHITSGELRGGRLIRRMYNMVHCSAIDARRIHPSLLRVLRRRLSFDRTPNCQVQTVEGEPVAMSVAWERALPPTRVAAVRGLLLLAASGQRRALRQRIRQWVMRHRDQMVTHLKVPLDGSLFPVTVYHAAERDTRKLRPHSAGGCPMPVA